MCWKMKVPTPNYTSGQIVAPEPEPLKEAPEGVTFGGDDPEDKAFGRELVKVNKTTTTTTKSNQPKVRK